MGDARAWLRRFNPSVLLREDDGQLWVTDHSRMHRVPPVVAAELDGIDLEPGASVELSGFEAADSIEGRPGPDFPVQRIFDDLVGSIELPVQAVDESPRV